MKLYTAQWGDRCYFSSASQQSADVANLPKNIKRDIIESFIPDMYQYLLFYTGCWLAPVLQLWANQVARTTIAH